MSVKTYEQPQNKGNEEIHHLNPEENHSRIDERARLRDAEEAEANLQHEGKATLEKYRLGQDAQEGHPADWTKHPRNQAQRGKEQSEHAPHAQEKVCARTQKGKRRLTWLKKNT